MMFRAEMTGFNASVLAAIGYSPIVELNRSGAEVSSVSLAKLEFTSIGSGMSCFDR